MKTRVIKLSEWSINTLGREYTDRVVGMRAVYTTYDGDKLIGTITRWERGYPIIEFDDGRWARLDNDAITVVVEG